MTYQFGEYTLDPITGTLTGPDGPVALRRQAFRLCETLLRHAPQLLDRDTLLDEVWGRTALSANVLPQTISELRQALGDSAQQPRFIETVHRRGYRMACPVTVTAATSRKASARRWRPLARLALVLALIASTLIGGLAYRAWQTSTATRNLYETAIPGIRELLERDLFAAWSQARELRQRFPDDPVLGQLWLDITLPSSLSSEPAGAEVQIRPFADASTPWITLGTTPLKDVRLPLTMLQFRVSLEHHASLEVAPSVLPEAETFRLHPLSSVPEDMVFVPGGSVRYMGVNAELPDFWIGRTEVTNSDYARFVRDGGYQRPEFWVHTAMAGDTPVTGLALAGLFLDSTGMPGPSTWALGTYPEGLAEHPVAGVSWYEADAYARYMNAALPSVFHWWRAAGFGASQVAMFSGILGASNFSGQGTTAAGSLGGLGPYGTLDMAGNVAEWCANADGDRRHLLGGAWHEASYRYVDPNAQPALQRGSGTGFRLLRSPRDPGPEATRSVSLPAYPPAVPADDTVFNHYRRLFDYDPVPLDARLEAVDDSHPEWRRERISLAAGYPGERLLLQLFLPRNRNPPLQTVLHFPGGDALMMESSHDASLLHIEPFLRSGRAVVYPVYQGTFERRQPPPPGPFALRDQMVQQVKDARRALDYLESRSDFDLDRSLLHALSYGGWRAPLILAVEKRLTAAVIMSAGLVPQALPDEIQLPHYLPRVTQPVLYITGCEDFGFPLEQSQAPFFELLGSRPDDKRHLLLDWGHLPPGYAEVARELLAWADQWLGKP
ncbi:MAG: SUMF1/EgtB/PvdO family nonheme iron enzyme [Haliea sp.]